jgi:hypothetical protein
LEAGVRQHDGSGAHLSTEQFKALAGIDLTHVPYKGSGIRLRTRKMTIVPRLSARDDSFKVFKPSLICGCLFYVAVGLYATALNQHKGSHNEMHIL